MGEIAQQSNKVGRNRNTNIVPVILLTDDNDDYERKFNDDER